MPENQSKELEEAPRFSRASKVRRARARPKPLYAQMPVMVGIGAGLFCILVVITFILSGGSKPAPSPLPAQPAPEAANPELEAAKAMYNEAFRLMGNREYEGALPKVAAACATFAELMDKHQSLVWVEDYFQRLNRWERELREWEFARESEAFRKASRP